MPNQLTRYNQDLILKGVNLLFQRQIKPKLTLRTSQYRDSTGRTRKEDMIGGFVDGWIDDVAAWYDHMRLVWLSCHGQY
jgi:hypothetical protein